MNPEPHDRRGRTKGGPVSLIAEAQLRQNALRSASPLPFEFTCARLKHITWKLRFRDYLNGVASIDESRLTSEHRCELGMWLAQFIEGDHGWPHIAELAELIDAHVRVHGIGREIVRAMKLGDLPAARRAFQSLDALSAQLIRLLDQLESKLNPRAGRLR